MSNYSLQCPSCGSINRIPADKEGRRGRCGSCHRTLPPLYYHPQQLTDNSFNSFIAEYHQPILVEFWAPW